MLALNVLIARSAHPAITPVGLTGRPSLRVISIEDLIRAKESLARPKDFYDSNAKGNAMVISLKTHTLRLPVLASLVFGASMIGPSHAQEVPDPAPLPL